MKKKIIITSIIGISLIASAVIPTYLIIDYKNGKAFQLDVCIREAKIEREDLWDANSDEEGYISDMESIEWIEQRYEQDLNACYRLYD